MRFRRRALHADGSIFCQGGAVYFPIVRSNLAVMSIFRAMHVPAQGRLEMSDLRARWPRYALRQRDLDRSVDRLASLGMVEIDHTRRGLKYIVLTAAGHRSAHSLPGLLGSLMVWPRRFGLAVGALLRRKALYEARRRRLDPIDRGPGTG
jgi:hypothetical protein